MRCARFHLTPIAIFPAIATVTMFASYFITQKLSGMDAQMQGSMKVMMLVMNLMFVTFCFNAPVGFSLYYGVSNVVQIFQSYVTYKIYSPRSSRPSMRPSLPPSAPRRRKSAPSPSSRTVSRSKKRSPWARPTSCAWRWPASARLNSTRTSAPPR